MRTRVAAVAGAATAFVLLTATPALAHATYKSSDPADDSSVSSPPSEVWAEFTEPMSSEGSYMDVTDPCGRDVGSTTSQTANEMTVQMNGVAQGTYTVFWRAASVDGHITEGEFEFTSSGGEPCPGEEVDEGSGNGGGTASGGGGSGSSGAGTSVASGGAGSEDGSGGSTGKDLSSDNRGVEKQGKNGGGKGKGGDRSQLLAAPGPDRDQPEAPSTLDGIPVGGLLVTLAISALIGAAAGKIYVSLSGDSS